MRGGPKDYRKSGITSALKRETESRWKVMVPTQAARYERC